MIPLVKQTHPQHRQVSVVTGNLQDRVHDNRQVGSVSERGRASRLTSWRTSRSPVRHVLVVWHGPLLMACLLSAVTITDRIVPDRLWDALPVFLLLAAWAAIGIKRRLRQAAELQREIDEITVVSPMED